MTSLPALEGLRELALVRVADFSVNPEIASPAYPLAASRNEVVFYDSRLRQLFKAGFDGRDIVPFGRFGEGPGEYTHVLGLLLEDENVYILDGRRRVICLDSSGRPVWEEKIGGDFTGLIGKRGDVFYFEENRAAGDFEFRLGLTGWSRATGARLLCDRPIVTARGHAVVDGKFVEGGGFMFVALPAFALAGDTLVASASNRYAFDLLDLDGNIREIREYEAPHPEPLETGRFLNSELLENYAISRIMPWNGGFLAVSNYRRQGKPRLDRFSAAGDLLSSHLLPFEFDPPGQNIVIQGERLFHIDREISGFQAFRLTEEDLKSSRSLR